MGHAIAHGEPHKLKHALQKRRAASSRNACNRYGSEVQGAPSERPKNPRAQSAVVSFMTLRSMSDLALIVDRGLTHYRFPKIQARQHVPPSLNST
jgi:hypothetical protein